MNSLHLKNIYASDCAEFTTMNGIEVPARFSDEKTEYDRIRNSVGVTDFSWMQKYIVPEETGVDFLDEVFPASISQLRFGRVVHTFLANDSGEIIADCYIANNDDELIVLCEAIVEGAEIWEIFSKYGADKAGMKDVSQSHCLIGFDGYDSWKVAREAFGVDTLSLPYLSVERYPFDDFETSVIRAGKTSEYGYLVLVENEHAEKMMKFLLEKAGESENGGMVGALIHHLLRLEGRFFNIHAEGRAVKNPLILGLQWMIDFSKENWHGSQPVLSQRQKGFGLKIVGMQYEMADTLPEQGTQLFAERKKYGQVVASCRSYVLNSAIFLATFPVEVAYAGLEFNLGSETGPAVHSISMPPIMPKSLSIKLSEM